MSVIVWAMAAWQSTICARVVEAMKIAANGLEHHALVWPGHGSTVVLVHGYMDAAGTWDRVAPTLAESGHRVVALDMRGFGEGPRAPRGAYYHFADYIFDLADAIEVLSPSEPVQVVGHSMGGTIATLYSGSFPERVAKVALLEGLGPPDTPPEIGAARMRHWIDQVRRVRANANANANANREGAAPTLTLEEARRRLAGNHPNVPPDVLEHRLTTAPVPFVASLYREFARKITCPVLFVSGGPTGFHPPDEEDRLAAFAKLERAEIADAGHMMHWTKPDEVARVLLRFLSS
jgi:pimeloyl-ACP methyl ester carboxylesterase